MASDSCPCNETPVEMLDADVHWSSLFGECVDELGGRGRGRGADEP